jgi:ketosteroid isomerase-like protein
MRYLFSFVLVSIFVFSSCASRIGEGENDFEQSKELVLEALNSQEDSWNNGDIDGFMNGYWNNDSLMFVSGERVSYGWQKVADNYKKTYNSKELMGKLTFNVIKTDQLSNTALLVVGSWNLDRGDMDIQGKFSLLWRKIDGEWKIVIDHTS